jgi:hypothetical protein
MGGLGLLEKLLSNHLPDLIWALSPNPKIG